MDLGSECEIFASGPLFLPNVRGVFNTSLTVILLWLVRIAVGLLVFYIGLKIFCWLTHVNYKKQISMKGKTVLITGATGGIGKETARGLARTGARVIMACRNLELAEHVKNDIINDTGNSNVVVKQLDVSSFQSVRKFAKDINDTEPRLDVLIHNAGYAGYAPCQSADGIEMTLATNHYGPFLLTHLLIDLLKRSGPSRIVVVSSCLHVIGKVDLNNPNPLTVLPGYLYYVSKKSNVLFTLELARRLKGTNVTANFLHPGLIDSGIWRNIPQPHITFIRLCNLFAKSAVEGSQTTIYASVDPDLESVSGEYFLECRKFWFSKGNRDPERLKQFWEASVKLCRLQEDDPLI